MTNPQSRWVPFTAPLVVALCLASCEVNPAQEALSPSPRPTPSATISDSTPEGLDAQLAQVGDPVHVGDLALVVVGWRTFFTISSGHYTTQVETILVNQGDHPCLINPSRQIWISSDRGSFYPLGQSEDSQDPQPGLYGVLLPGERVRGVLSFPTARRGERLLIHFHPSPCTNQLGVVRLLPGPTHSPPPARFPGESAPALHPVGEPVRAGGIEVGVASVRRLSRWEDWTDWYVTVVAEIAVSNKAGDPAKGVDHSYVENLYTGDRIGCLWREEGQTRSSPTTAGSLSPGDDVRTQVLCPQQALSESYALGVEGPGPEPWKTLFNLNEVAPPSAGCLVPKLLPTPKAPTPTPSPTSTPPWDALQLTDRRPAKEDVEAYIGEEVTHMYFEDVNGDGQFDLVVASDFWDAYVILWEGGRYGPPTRIWPDETGYKTYAGMRVTLRDWTGDGVPEIVYENVCENGETGLFIRDWYTKITHCEASRCWTVWSDWTASLGNLARSGGMHYYWSALTPASDALGRPLLRQTYTGFSVYGFAPQPFSGWAPRLNEDYPYDFWSAGDPYELREKVFVDVGMVFEYAWNGKMFELVGEQVATAPRVISSHAQLRAVGMGVAASVEVERWPEGRLREFQNDTCQLYVNGQAASGLFGCKYNFTYVDWQDITHDGVPEVVVSTISEYESHLGDEDWQTLSEKGCFHQRLLAYSWDGRKAKLVANVEGCVRRPDLFGVALTDYDQDGQKEILAADEWLLHDRCLNIGFCWHELSQLYEIYEWNGQAFILAR